MAKAAIKVTIYSGKQGDSFYVSDINGKWEQDLLKKLGGVKTEKGSLKFNSDPQPEMIKMRINYELVDKREKQTAQNKTSSQQNNSGDKVVADKVWKHGNEVCVRFAGFRTDKDMRESFKKKFGADWNKEKEFWVIKDSKVGVQEVEDFLGLVTSGEQKSNANGCCDTVNFVLTKDEVIKFQAMLSHLQAGGSVAIAS